MLAESWYSASAVLRGYADEHPNVEARWKLHWERGLNAPDEEVSQVLWDALTPIQSGYIFSDGYPRTRAQLDDFSYRGGHIDFCLLLSIADRIAFTRIRSRGAVSGRPDDADELAASRIESEAIAISHMIGSPLIKGRIITIEADRSEAAVLSDAIARLNEAKE
jgi:adenylate kinase family enzyme